MLAGGIVSRLISGFVADYIGGIRTLLIGSVMQCLALFLYLPFDGLASLYVVSAVFGLSQGGIVPCYALIVREYLPAREAGRRVGIVITATVVGMAVGGWCQRRHLRPDRLLSGGVPQRHRLEPPEHRHHGVPAGTREAPQAGVAAGVRITARASDSLPRPARWR